MILFAGWFGQDWGLKEKVEEVKTLSINIANMLSNPFKIFGQKFSKVKFFGPMLTFALKSLIGQKLSNKDYDAVGVGLTSLFGMGMNMGDLTGVIRTVFAGGGLVESEMLRKEENVSKWISKELKKE